jgi:hypothetical protein
MTTFVWHYRVKDKLTGEVIICPDKCTFDCVQALGGEIINGTMETVAKSSLDPDGHYRPNRAKSE